MVESTHDVTLGSVTVTKRFRSWSRGEPDREWAALRLLGQYCPGLAAEPHAFDRAGDAPVVVMSRLPGASLGAEALTSDQTDGIATALRTMFGRIPHEQLDRLPDRISGGAELYGDVVAGLRGCGRPIDDVTRRAVDESEAWLRGLDASVLAVPRKDRVLGLGDGNIGNFVWDGCRCRLVDFEDSGISEPGYELADLVEHVTARGLVDPDRLTRRFEWSREQERRFDLFRRLFAVFWLLMLVPGGRGHHRNPAGSDRRQAEHVLALL